MEQELNKKRKEMDLDKKSEKTIVKGIVGNALCNNRIGEKVFLNIEPYYIHTPEWQRNLNVSKAMKIGNNYNPALWDAPKILYSNGLLFAIDGDHRVYGTCFAGMDKIVVEVLTDTTEEEAINIFLDQGKNRKHVSPSDGFNASIAAKKPEYLLMKKICDKHRVQIKGDINPPKNPVGLFTTINDGVNMAKMNPELLEKILTLIGKLKWNADTSAREGKAYTAKVIRSFKMLYANYADQEKQMENILLTNCKGSEYFNAHLAKKWQDSFFDHLTTIIENGMKTVQFTEASGKRGKMII